MWRRMALDAAQEASVEIAASPAECFAAIVEFERYPEWFSAVSGARILERDKAGIGRIVEFTADMKIRTVRYVLEYAYKKPSELTWQSIEGDIESVQGRYTFRKLGAALTEATCRQEIQLGFWVPGPLRKIAERTALRQSVNELKAEVERRVAAPSAHPSRPAKRDSTAKRKR
jgi:ribosome-associated toxin RatA of RatAB toxin-antitoxin module